MQILAMIALLAVQVPNPPSPRLAGITRLTCTFPAMTTGTWTNGVPATSSAASKLTVGFTSVSTEDGTADVVGNAGTSHVTVRLVGNYLHFMQMDAYGAMYLTTVFATESRPGHLLAAHSRHEYTPVQARGMTSRPEQYFGECNAK